MLSLIWRTIKNRKTPLISYTLGAVSLLWMMLAMYPLFEERQVEFDKLLQAYPKDVFKALGMDFSEFTLATVESWIAVEHLSMMWPILAIIMVIAFGGAMIAGEIEKGTIETILAQPISRLKIYLSKYFAGVISYFIFVVVSFYAIIPLAYLHDIDFKIENWTTAAILGFLFGLAIFSLSMLASSIFSEKSKSNFTIGGILLLMYVLNIITKFKENIEDLKYLSFFHYYDYSAAMNRNTIDDTTIWVFLGVSVVATILGAIWFIRRDIAE